MKVKTQWIWALFFEFRILDYFFFLVDIELLHSWFALFIAFCNLNLDMGTIFYVTGVITN